MGYGTLGRDPGGFREKEVTSGIEMRERIRSMILSCGASACGFACAGDIPEECDSQFREWIASGHHAGMDYLERHVLLRRNLSNVLEGVSTVISVAFDFSLPDSSFPVAGYAVGKDYHKTLRQILKAPCADISVMTGGRTRVCIDSAPVAERYWAVKSGIGIRGVNGSVIIPGHGSCCFLAEILLTAFLPPDSPGSGEIECGRCGACVRLCPMGAISGDGTIDSRKCLNYLTIEHKGSFPDEAENLTLVKLFGCDVCLGVCPHNHNCKGRKVYPDFLPMPRITGLTKERIKEMTEEEYDILLQGSPLRRAGLSGLRRNAEKC